MPKGFTEYEKELISKRLIEQGYRLFSAYGLKKTNLDEIAAAAGISKGAFYLFYDSKEALFMDCAELAEVRFRQEILAIIDLPGPSPRARFLAVLKRAFNLIKTIPLLQFFTGSDYDLLFRRIPQEKLQEHLSSDQVFFDELFTRCQNAGIPIRVQSSQVLSLLYPLVIAYLREDDPGASIFSSSIDQLLELAAAFCVGEIELESQKPFQPTSQP